MTKQQKTDSKKYTFLILILLLFLSGCFTNPANTHLSKDTVQSNVPTIVYPSDSSDLELLAAKEVRRYIYMRTDSLLSLQAVSSLPPTGDLILLANDNNSMVEELRGLLNHTTAASGIIIKTVSEGGRNILVITGNDDDATLHAAYRYAEHLGVFCGLAEDVIPDAKISLDITGYDEAGIPNFETNGIQPYHDFPSGPDLWSTEDYLHFITQLPKMGMNFIGVHTYPRYNSLWDKENGHNRGPEPSVWIGLEEDFNSSTGDVKWSYPAYYAHSQRPNWIWGFDQYNTGNYHAGAKDLFPTDGWGSDVMGQNPPQDGDIAASNAVFNRTGEMFNTAFTHAQNIGVKTALGTELPLGLENDGYDSWVRGMPQVLQDRLQDMGKDPADPATVKEVYKGIFKRIIATHPLDYYWLWSYEIWPGDNPTWVQSFEDDISLAIEALNELGNPFQIAHAGWQLGTDENPAELENVFPSEAPFFSLMGSAIGYEELSSERVKWPSTWLEYDRSLGQPELAVDRVHEDAYAAWGVNAEGFIAENWRTRIMSPNIGAMRELSWTYGPTGEPLSKNVPTWPGDFVDNFYVNWATRMFGAEAAFEIANIFHNLENDMPHPVEWAEEQTGTYYMVPGAILANSTSWSTEESRYGFVADFENLRSKIVGEGNLERFDYWLKTWQALKLKGEYGCVRYQFEDAMEKNEWTDALNHRKTMARLWEQIMELEVEKATNVSDLGDIMNLEVVNWKQLMMNKHDEALEAGLGNTLPTDANPSQTYTGDPFIKVLAPRTHVYEKEALRLKVIAMGVSAPSLKYRPLGETSWNTISLTNVGRSVYEVTIPAQGQDFEYYIESGSTVYPVTAPDIHSTVVVSGKENSSKFSLTTNLNGEGSIKLEPEGFRYDAGTVVTATADPEIGHSFNSWSGAATGSEDSVTILMDGNKTITASFRSGQGDEVDNPDLPSTWQPWDWNGYEKFPSLYFAAEPEGHFNSDQMQKISRFSLAILEFRMGQFVEEFTTGKWAGGDLAGFMEQQVQIFEAAYPDGPPMLVYRNGMWAGSMFEEQWNALQNQSLFIEDERLCEGFINYPMDVDESGFETDLKYCRWDFRKYDTRKVYSNLIGLAAKENSDGVFFDNAQSVACDESNHYSYVTKEERQVFMESQLEVYAEVFSELVNNGKYPILSTTNGFENIGAQVPWENDCPLAEEAIIDALEGIPFARNNEFWMWNLGETAAKQIRNSIQETKNGIPIIVHMPYFPNDDGCLEGCIKSDGTIKSFTQDEFLEFGIAAFLVSMGPGSYFGFSNMQNDPELAGWGDVSWEYHSQYDSIVTGAPIGEVNISNDGMTFTRQFENGTVWVNCADGTYGINLSNTVDLYFPVVFLDH